MRADLLACNQLGAGGAHLTFFNLDFQASLPREKNQPRTLLYITGLGKIHRVTRYMNANRSESDLMPMEVRLIRLSLCDEFCKNETPIHRQGQIIEAMCQVRRKLQRQNTLLPNNYEARMQTKA
jgi:hypothetical protein